MFTNILWSDNIYDAAITEIVSPFTVTLTFEDVGIILYDNPLRLRDRCVGTATGL